MVFQFSVSSRELRKRTSSPRLIKKKETFQSFKNQDQSWLLQNSYSSSPSPPPMDSNVLTEDQLHAQVHKRLEIDAGGVAKVEVFHLRDYRFVNGRNEEVPFKPDFLDADKSFSVIGQVAHMQKELGMVRVDHLSFWAVCDKEDLELWKEDGAGRIWLKSSKAWYVLFSPHDDYKLLMDEWPEIVDLEYCVHRAAKEGQVKNLEEVELDCSLTQGAYSLPLRDGLDLMYKHAASIYENRDPTIRSPIYDQLKKRLRSASSQPSRKARKFPIAPLDNQKLFHSLIESKLEMRTIQDFPPIPKEVKLKDPELRDGELIFDQGLGASIKPGSFVLLSRGCQLTKSEPWVFLIKEFIKEIKEGGVEEELVMSGFWALPRNGFPLLGRFQNPGELIIDFSNGLNKQPVDTIDCVLPVVILNPEQLPPENQWFARLIYKVGDSCHILSTFCLEDLNRSTERNPQIKSVKPGDWVEYLDPRYENSTFDPEKVTGRVKSIKKDSEGTIVSVVVQRSISRDTLISDPSPKGADPPAHLSRLQIEEVRPKKNEPEIVLLLKSGSRRRPGEMELAEMEVDIENVYDFISVFGSQSRYSVSLMAIAEILPESQSPHRIIAGVFDANSADRIRASTSGPCHPDAILDFHESLSQKLLPEEGYYLSPEMKAEDTERRLKQEQRGENSESSSEDQFLTVLDLCCGLGGISLGLQQAGLQIQTGVDVDAKALETFKENFDAAETVEEKVEILCEQLDEAVESFKQGKMDKREFFARFMTLVIIAGPSCKGHSFLNPDRSSGKHNDNYFSILSLIAYLMPAYVVIENVPTLVNSRIGEEENVYFKLILSTIVDLGYQVSFANLVSSEYGVPQNRARLIFLCTRAGLPMTKIPEATHKVEAKQRGRILQSGVKEKNKEAHDPSTFKLFKTPRIPARDRARTVEDAISDLPGEVESGETHYASEPWNFYQRCQRGDKRIFGLPCWEVDNEEERIRNQTVRDHTSRYRSLTGPSSASSLKRKREEASSSTSQSLNKVERAIPRLRLGPHQPQDFDSKTGSLHMWTTENPTDREFRRFRRAYPHEPIETVTSQLNSTSHMTFSTIHPYEDREWTDAEGKRLHSFPDDFKFPEGFTPQEKWRLMGQAVSPLLAKAIGQSIVKAQKEAIKQGLWNDSEEDQMRLICRMSDFGERKLEMERERGITMVAESDDDGEEEEDHDDDGDDESDEDEEVEGRDFCIPVLTR